jgi:potassium-transporting ATPase KdpC subunit
MAISKNTSKILSPAIRVVVIMVVTTGIAYPLLLTAIGQTAFPNQSNGSQVVMDEKVIGSKLIAQEFDSPKFFHARPSSDSASGVDPDITIEDANLQISSISESTGIPVNTIKTLVELEMERNRNANALVFAPDYVNVLELNVELVKNYPQAYQHEIKGEI